MACRNCGRAGGDLYDVVLAGERRVDVTLCGRCHDAYVDLGWIEDATLQDETDAG